MTDTAAIRTFLGQAPLFDGLSATTIDKLVTTARFQSFRKGSHVFFQGDVAGRLYVVRSGWVVILLSNSDGRELVLSEMRPGDVFGENGVLSGAKRSATAVAREASEVLEIAGPTFLAAIDADPRLARRLLLLAVARLDAGNERESALAFLHAGARVARVLHSLDDMDRQTADKGYVTVSQDEIAQRTGLTRQTVARFLGRWRRQGWLLTGRGRIMLLNRDSLFALEDDTLD